jgi:hypothetical protein
MKRKITIENGDSVIRIIEDDRDDSTSVGIYEAATRRGSTITLDPDQLWKLAEQILAWFDAKPVRTNEYRHTLRGKIFDVLVDNEARCLDDNIDRDVVLRELVKALS